VSSDMDLNLHWLKFAIDNMISLSNSIGLNNVWYVLLAPRKLNVLFNILLLPQELYTGGNDRQILVWSTARPIADEMVHSLNQFFEIIFYICMLRAPTNLSLSDPWDKLQGEGDPDDQDSWSNWEDSPSFVS
jgi:hypothetical protein